ncbi:hypothetical protein Nepgr_020102 [Nepenthes gracilis]|uniref:Uncharacterized protein n=1 Tax=Nepenthes gracilis TaxID=150966 RepID=A0AAD3SYH5_NEPGR|nr:hypothetical protein Nepgr_020102 [Nepenthes gracilis]
MRPGFHYSSTASHHGQVRCPTAQTSSWSATNWGNFSTIFSGDLNGDSSNSDDASTYSGDVSASPTQVFYAGSNTAIGFS